MLGLPGDIFLVGTGFLFGNLPDLKPGRFFDGLLLGFFIAMLIQCFEIFKPLYFSPYPS
jgi:hypothetical protein